MSRLPLLLLPLLVLACMPREPAPEPGNPMTTCGADGWQHLVGQSGDVLAAAQFPAPMRVLRPGDITTMEFLAERLNVAVDEQNRITRVYCG